MANTFNTTRNEGSNITAEVHWPENRPHWRRSGKGSASMKFTANKVVGWLEINSCEYGKDERGVTNAEKRTMLTMDKEQAAALRDWLVANLPR